MDQAGRVRHERRAAPRNAALGALPPPARLLDADLTLEPSDVRILLVEDDAAIEGLLRRFGHDLCAPHDGRDVVAAALAVRPDVVICDVDAPEHDAWQLAADFRGDPAFRHTALVALSRLPVAGGRERALQAGFDAYLIRPVTAESLQAALEMALRM